jgi:UDP-N-acetyl-2-amino-2-deoxyglucuronate dehydrogenase
MKLKFAIVGTGMISHIHAEAIQSLFNAELTYVFSRNEKSGSEFARLYGCKHTTVIEDFLKSDDIHVISVCTPSGTHAEWVVHCANHGKHVLVEKPLDISLVKSNEAIQACKKKGVKLGVIFQLRFMDETRRVKRILEEGTIGKLIEVDTIMKFYRSEAYYSSSSWKGTYDLDGGGSLMNQGIHGIDLMLWLAGPVTSLTAQIHTLKHDIEVEDTAIALVNFRNGAIGVIQGATSIYPDQPQLLSFHGMKGTLELAGTEVPFIRRLDIEDKPQLSIHNMEPPADHLGRAHREQYTDFVEAIIEDREPMVTGEEGQKSIEIVSAIYRSSREGRRIDIPVKE